MNQIAVPGTSSSTAAPFSCGRTDLHPETDASIRSRQSRQILPPIRSRSPRPARSGTRQPRTEGSQEMARELVQKCDEIDRQNNSLENAAAGGKPAVRQAHFEESQSRHDD